MYSHILSLPFLLPPKQKRSTCLPFLFAFWTSDFFSSSRVPLSVNTYVYEVEEAMGGKGLAKKVQDRALNRIFEKI